MKVIEIEDGIKIPNSKGKLALMWFGSVAILALCIWFLFFTKGYEARKIFVSAAAVFFCFVVIALPVSLLHKTGGLYITASGINAVTPFVKEPFVAWDEIECFSRFQSGSSSLNTLVLVHLKDPDAYLAKLSFVKRKLAQLSINMSGTPYSLTANYSQCNNRELLDVLQESFEKYKK